MKINKFVLQNFKRFSNKTIEFADGFNVVIGENESGKSTIVEALFLILYANPASKSKDLLNYYSWKNDQPFCLELDFEILGKKYYLKKDFSTKEGVLRLPSGKEILNLDLIQDCLYSELKIPLESVYLNSGFIKQDEMLKMDYDGDFQNSIQNMVIEGEDEVDISGLIKGLDKKIGVLSKGLKGNSMNPGPIKALTEKISKDEIETKTIEDKWLLSLGSREIVEGNNQEILKVKEDINIKQGFLKKISALKDLSKKALEYNSKYDELVKVEDEYKENESDIKDLEQKIISDYKIYKDINQISKVEEEINSLLAQEEVLSKVKPRMENLDNKEQKLNLTLGFGIIAIAVLLSVILKDILPFVLSLVGLGLYVLSIKYQQGKQAKTPIPSQEEDHLLGETKEKLEKLCQRFETENVQKILKDILEYRTLRSQISELELKKKYILGKLTIDEIGIKRQAILKEISKIDLLIDESKVGSENYSEEKIHQLNYDIEKEIARQQKLEKETMLMEATLASSAISQEDINIRKEQLEEDKSELLNYKDELQVLELVKNSIMKSYEETIKDSSVVIEELINLNISHLTNGRYSKVKLSADLEIEVFSKEKGEFITWENLSKGTIDQIFMLARLGFAQGLFGSNKMPIILDDPFVNFDEKRLLNMKEILVKMSADFQMILFSHNKNYSDWGKLSGLE